MRFVSPYPAVLSSGDSVVTFSSVAFEDEDLDAEELGGAIVLEPAGGRKALGAPSASSCRQGEPSCETIM